MVPPPAPSYWLTDIDQLLKDIYQLLKAINQPEGRCDKSPSFGRPQPASSKGIGWSIARGLAADHYLDKLGSVGDGKCC
jgi:hypothetical protein